MRSASAWAWQPHEVPPAAAFEGVNSEVHLAGEPVAGRWTAAKREAIEQSRVAGTKHLVQAMAALDITGHDGGALEQMWLPFNMGIDGPGGVYQPSQ